MANRPAERYAGKTIAPLVTDGAGEGKAEQSPLPPVSVAKQDNATQEVVATEEERNQRVVARLTEFVAAHCGRLKIQDAPPVMPGTEWRAATDGGWNLWEILADDLATGGARKTRYCGWLKPEVWRRMRDEYQQIADEIATRGQKPKPAELATRGQVADVVDLAERRDKRLKTQQPELATRGQNKTATRGQKTLTKKGHAGAGKPYIEAVGASIGTMAFRLRWRENGKRQPPIYLSRVSLEVYEIIKGGDYEAFKQQLVASHSASALRARDTA